jgi:ribonuclease T2
VYRSVEQIKREFTSVNRDIPATSIAVICAGGHYLREIRLCYDKDMRPRACGPMKTYCKGQDAVIRPLRR